MVSNELVIGAFLAGAGLLTLLYDGLEKGENRPVIMTSIAIIGYIVSITGAIDIGKHRTVQSITNGSAMIEVSEYRLNAAGDTLGVSVNLVDIVKD